MKTTQSLHTATADLHIHTCLSPCASLDMTPLGIVREALAKKLAFIAVTDHNSAQNTTAVTAAARDTGLCVIPGMELTTAEEVHLLALFETPRQALELQETVFDQLQPGENDESLFGMQVIANELDEVEGFNPRLLIGSTFLTIDDAVELIHRLGGLAIPAHIDRPSYSLMAQLGFLPDHLDVDAVEISKRLGIAEARSRYGTLTRLPFVSSSDSHELNAIGSALTRLAVAEPCFSELKKALCGTDGRTILE